MDKKIVTERRKKLRDQVKSGVILIAGNQDTPMNYPKNTYFFRQDSTFLYFTGMDQPGLALVIDADTGEETLFGDDVTIEDIIWMGPQVSMKSKAQKVGIKNQRPLSALEEMIQKALQQKRKIHFLPAYRAEKKIWLGELLGLQPKAVNNYISPELIQAVIELRSCKSAEEIGEIEEALAVTELIYQEAHSLARPGLREFEVAGRLEGIALEAGRRLSFPPIVTVRGETLHNQPTQTPLKNGDLLIVDAGAESFGHYASDITRTYPVSGKFTSRQKEIYQIVLKAQTEALAAIKPGVFFRDVHMLAAKTIVEGLKTVGLMKGDAKEAVSQGAHALFFPHGLGHMLGLDVHDMEDLGENYVGYDAKTKRSTQFGLAYLRLAKKLKPGNVVTVEPGIYFIPALIDQWKAEKKHTPFINYGKLDAYKKFGGMRVEDDVLVTRNANRVLGKPIAKSVQNLEKHT